MSFFTRELSLNQEKGYFRLIYRPILINTFLLSPKCLLKSNTLKISTHLQGLLSSGGHIKANAYNLLYDLTSSFNLLLPIHDMKNLSHNLTIFLSGSKTQ